MARLFLTVLVTLNMALTYTSALPVEDQARNVLQDLEQKDLLLGMLETKLKEVRDHKKKAADYVPGKCEALPKNVDIKLKANGISGVGETDLLLKYGQIGNGTLNLSASGISNVGKAHIELGGGEGTLIIPGLSNLFAGTLSRKNCEENQNEQEVGLVEFKSKRSGASDAKANDTNNITLVEGTTAPSSITDTVKVAETAAIARELESSKPSSITVQSSDSTNANTPSVNVTAEVAASSTTVKVN